MSGNTLGTLFTVTTFGESHGPAIGCVIDGCPPGIKIAGEDFTPDLARRATGKTRHTSARQEADAVEILSGVYEGQTTGTPIALLIRNTDYSAPELYELVAPHIDPELAHLTYSMQEGILEVAAPNVTKRRGVEWLAEHTGVAQQETIAFGDMPNDIEMLRWAGCGVAMENAHPEVKAAADAVTVANHQAGVAKVLERWF